MEEIKEIFVINLNKSVDRLSTFDKSIKHIGIHTYTRWEAVNGYELSSDERKHLSKGLCKWVGCAPGVIGCYLSHITLMKHILDKYRHEEKGWFLVFEDDAVISQHFKDYVKDLFADDLKKVSDVDILQLGRFTKILPSYQVSTRLNKTMFLNGTTCYLINLKGIQKALERLGQHVFFHIDVAISLYTKMNIYVARDPYLIKHSHVNSTISNDSIPRATTALASIFDHNGTTMLSSTIFYYMNGFINFNICIFVYGILGIYALKKKNFWILLVILLLELLFWIIQQQNKKQ